jgi:hypothetical protein
MRNETTSMPTSTARYYVGDLCYVMNPEWSEVCDLTFPDHTTEVTGKLQLADGRKFAIYGTAHGDGTYRDFYGHSYSVDSGTLGIIKVDDITDPEFQNAIDNGLGHIIELPEEFETLNCGYDDGVVCFGHIEIITSFGPDEDEEEEFSFTDEDEEDGWHFTEDV